MGQSSTKKQMRVQVNPRRRQLNEAGAHSHRRRQAGGLRAVLIIVVSFLPVFLLEAQEGRMFRPLAWTKTLAVGFSSLLAITLVSHIAHRVSQAMSPR
jgi:Cu/Ag efflux pump CusA